jgi:glycerophosphoryl diester phosphodiesterase
LNSPKPLLLGHRGARRYAPENTIAAFDLALEHGCDGFEFDVRLTADQQGVICHDAEYSWVAVANCSLAKLHERLASLASLKSVIERYAATAFLDIELKVPGAETTITRLISENPPARGYVLSSFLPEILITLKEVAPQLTAGLIADRRSDLERWRDLPIQVVIPHHSLCSPALIMEAHEKQKQVFVWTVNRASDMNRFADVGVDAIISDDTALLCRTLRNR